MARPSVGKTLLAVNIASNLMDQQVKSLILSGEMLSEEVVQRFISIRYGIKPYIFESKP
jgi:replicative DNA helicase